MFFDSTRFAIPAEASEASNTTAGAVSQSYPKTHEKSFDTWILPLMAMDFLSPPALDTAQCRWRYCLIFWSSPNIAAPSRDSFMRNPAAGLCQHCVVTIIHLTWEIASILPCGPLPRLVVGIDQCLTVTEGRRSSTRPKPSRPPNPA